MKDGYKKILVAVDESKEASTALHEAVAISKRNNAELFVIHVKDETRLRGTSIAFTMIMEEIDEESKEIIKNITNEIDKETTFKMITFMGNPKRGIINFSRENNIDLIVIGANSKTLMDKILVGSTTAYVVAKAPCNVMVIK